MHIHPHFTNPAPPKGAATVDTAGRLRCFDLYDDLEGEERGREQLALAASPISSKAWLPDGYSRIFKTVCVWPFGLLDYGSATLRCKI